MTDPVGQWWAAFEGALTARGSRRRRIIDEIDDHLRTAIEAEAATNDPTGAALRRLGNPVLVAHGFRRRGWHWRTVVALWLPAAVAATISAATVEGAVQASLRSGANDPQIQVAEDTAAALDAGTAPAALVGPTPVDLSRSLAMSITVLDAHNAVLASSARLDGQPAHPPLGALSAATATAPNIVTWQPQPGVRQASVIIPWRGPTGHGTVITARSLRQVEQREDNLLQLVAAGWLTALGGAAIAALLAARWRDPDSHKPPAAPAMASA